MQVFALLHRTHSKQAAAKSRVRTYLRTYAGTYIVHVHTECAADTYIYTHTARVPTLYTAGIHTHSTCAYTIHSRYTNCTVHVCPYIVHSRFKCSELKSVHNDYSINENVVITMYSAVWPARPSPPTTQDAEVKGRDGGWRSLTSPTWSAVRWNGLASQTMYLTLLYCTSSHNVHTYHSHTCSVAAVDVCGDSYSSVVQTSHPPGVVSNPPLSPSPLLGVAQLTAHIPCSGPGWSACGG